MSDNLEAPERIWPYQWHRYEKQNQGGGQVEYVRADRIEALEAERDAEKARADALAEKLERAVGALQASEESIATFMGVHGYPKESGAQLVLDEARATLAAIQETPTDG